MDATPRKKKFNSISSILTKPDNSSTSSKGFGCRVRFPIYSCSFVKGKEDDDRDEREIKRAEVVSFKDVSRETELKFESEDDRSKNGERTDDNLSDETRNKISVSSDKKEEETSLNLGMGVGLMLLLSKSSTELNKMVELRKEMETLLLDLKNEIKKKNVPTSTENSSNAPISSSTSGGNENSSKCLVPFHEDGASNLVDGRFDKNVTEIHEMEAELEAELRRFQLSEESSALPPLLIGAIEPDNESDYVNDNLYDGLEDYMNYKEQPIIEEYNDQVVEDDDNGDYDNFTDGVNPRELERKLNEVLHSRQRERIEELEYALECAKSKLYEKDKEICWWRDTARLVTHHRDDSNFR